MSASYGAVSVTTTATLILASTPGRRGFLIGNNGSNIIYIGFDSAVTATTGMQLMPQDRFDQSGEQSVFKGAIWGITSAGASDTRSWQWTA